MTIFAIARRLLAYADIRFLDADDQPDESAQVDVVSTVNGAIQELCALAPAYLSRDRLSETFHAPVTATVTVTNGQRGITIPGWQEWMLGATVKIGSDPQENEVASVTSITTGTATALLSAPYRGATGTASATIYGDSIFLPAEVMRVLNPVEIAQGPSLAEASNRLDLRRRSRWGSRAGDYGRTARLRAIITGDTPVGTPTAYLVRQAPPGLLRAPLTGDRETVRLQLRCAPLPADDFTVHLEARLAAIANYELDEFGFDEPDNDQSPEPAFPIEWHELYLLPIALQRYTASPFFKNDGVKDEFSRQYKTALQALELMRPSAGARIHLIPRY